MSVKFSDIKDELQKALQLKLNAAPIIGENGYSLIEGFMIMPIREEFSQNDPFVAGPHIPIVGVVGNTTGRIYTFALKAILPNFQI